ncbi:hypothetical protein BsWGS_02141 [Bradybaena similaris]
MEKGKIFVGGLSWDTDKDALQAYFSQYGEVNDCVVMNNPQTGKSRGFGFVTFRDSAAVDVVLASPKHTIDGRSVDAKACSARVPGGGGGDRQSGGRGGGGGAGYAGRTTKIFIGGLPNDATDDNLKSCFSKFGQVLDVVVMYDQEKNRPRGFGFLTFDSEDAVEAAVSEQYVDFSGKKIECKRAEPRQGGRGGKAMHGGGSSFNGYSGDQNWGGMGDGANWNQYGYGQQQGAGFAGYGQQGYDQNWGQQGAYPQSYGQGAWGQQAAAPAAAGGYGQSYGQPQQPPPPQPSWGGQPPNGQGRGYGGYSGPGCSSYGGNPGQPQGYGGYSGPGFGGSQGYSGGGGSSGGGNYGGPPDSYNNGAYPPNPLQGGKSNAGGGGAGGYHPYKR